MDSHIVLSVNGVTRELAVPAERTLLDVVREDLDLTGTKMACDDGECGSCFMLLGEKAVMSCRLAAVRAQGKEVTTIEGLGGNGSGVLHPLQEAFLEMGATQCGFCIPGMIIRAEALLRSKPSPDRETLVKSLSRNMCRCTGYMKIFDAVLYAAELKQGRARRNWPGRDNDRGVGTSVPRLDSPDTVDGAARYAADLKMDGMLHAKILRSPHHHARILSIDTSEARALPGVAAVVTADDIPGHPRELELPAADLAVPRRPGAVPRRGHRRGGGGDGGDRGRGGGPDQGRLGDPAGHAGSRGRARRRRPGALSGDAQRLAPDRVPRRRHREGVRRGRRHRGGHLSHRPPRARGDGAGGRARLRRRHRHPHRQVAALPPLRPGAGVDRQHPCSGLRQGPGDLPRDGRELRQAGRRAGARPWPDCSP